MGSPGSEGVYGVLLRRAAQIQSAAGYEPACAVRETLPGAEWGGA